MNAGCILFEIVMFYFFHLLGEKISEFVLYYEHKSMTGHYPHDFFKEPKLGVQLYTHPKNI